MKRLTISFFALFLFAAVSMSFISNDSINNDELVRQNSCTIKVENSSGSAASSVKVVGSVCGGISCVGNTKAYYTDSNGEVTIYWSEGCNLCYVYIDGKEHKKKCTNGGSYTFRK